MIRRVWRSVVGASLSVGCVAAVAAPVSAGADDQDRLDAAMEAFNQRMTDAGWESQGLPDEATEGSDPDAEDEEMSPSDEQFIECLGDMATIFEGTIADEFPGQTAVSYSDEFTFAPPADVTATTEFFSFNSQEESVAAFAATVDDENVANLALFVEALGDKAAGDCLHEAFEDELAADAEESEMAMDFEVDVVNEADLGVGDGSSRLSFEMSATLFGAPFVFDAGVLLAHVGNDIVGLTYGNSGDPTSGLDLTAELRTLVDSVSG